jgi:zinc protease
MTLHIIGDIDLNTISNLVEQTLPKPLVEGSGSHSFSSRLPAVAPAPPAPPPAKLVTKEAAVATPELWVGWSLPRGFDANAYLVEFANTVIGKALWAAESEDEDIAFVRTFVANGKDASMLLCQVGLTRGGHPEKSLNHVLNALSRVWTQEVSAQNIKLAEIAFRHQQRRAVVDMLIEAENIASRGISRATSTHFTGDPNVYSRAMRSMMKLDRSQVVEFAKKYVNRDRARAVLFHPPVGGGALPASIGVGANTVEDEDKRPVRADADRLKTIIPGIGASSFVNFTLENGLDVVLAPRPGLPIVATELLLYGGKGAANDLGSMHAGMWLQQPQAVWHGQPEDVGSRFRYNFDNDSISYFMSGSSGNANIILAMLAERVQSMSVDPRAWNRFERD